MKRATEWARYIGWRANSLIVVGFFLIMMGRPALGQDWQTFKYPSDGFSATFPVEPKEDSRPIETPSGTTDLHGYTLELNQVAFFVGVCDYGAKTDGSDVDAMLESAKNGAVTSSKAHLTRESKILLGRYHGIEFESETDDMHYVTRVYMVGGIMYQTLVVYPLGYPTSDTRRFLDSFQLLGREPN